MTSWLLILNVAVAPAAYGIMIFMVQARAARRVAREVRCRHLGLGGADKRGWRPRCTYRDGM